MFLVFEYKIGLSTNYMQDWLWLRMKVEFLSLILSSSNILLKQIISIDALVNT